MVNFHWKKHERLPKSAILSQENGHSIQVQVCTSENSPRSTCGTQALNFPGRRRLGNQWKSIGKKTGFPGLMDELPNISRIDWIESLTSVWPASSTRALNTAIPRKVGIWRQQTGRVQKIETGIWAVVACQSKDGINQNNYGHQMISAELNNTCSRWVAN